MKVVVQLRAYGFHSQHDAGNGLSRDAVPPHSACVVHGLEQIIDCWVLILSEG